MWTRLVPAAVLPAVLALGVPLLAEGPDHAPKPREKGWSTLRGRITWKGDSIPEREKAEVDKDRDCCLRNGPILSDKWIIDRQNRGVRWVYAWLEPDPDGGPKSLPIHPSLQAVKEKEVHIEITGCRYVPHAVAMREGQWLVVTNRDPTQHTANPRGHPLVNPGGGGLLPADPARQTYRHLVADSYPLVMDCAIHGWMRAWIRIYDHPYFALTQEDGRFEIKLAPAGAWRLKLWHEGIGYRGGKAGRAGMKITVRDEAVTDLGEVALNP